MLCAAALALSEAGSSIALGFPTANQSLYGFQLGASMLLPAIAFLMASHSLATDLETSRAALIFSRPISAWTFVLGKFLGLVSFVMCLLALPLAILLACTPMLHGVPRIYNLMPFLEVTCVFVLPAVLFSLALGLALASLFRKVIITFPLFLIYFFFAALLQSTRHAGLNWLDFTLRLYPTELVTEVPIRLGEYTFTNLLDPLSGTLLGRSVLYAGVALALLMPAVHWLAGRPEWVSKVCRAVAAWSRGSAARQTQMSAYRAPLALPNEMTLWLYSAKLLWGRNLLALALAAFGIFITVMGYRVGPYQTRESVVLFQLEILAPILGVIMFSDLVAADVEARRADLLRTSRRGVAWLAVRRIVHAAIFITGVVLVLVMALRMCYTAFSVSTALLIVLPNAIFFGAIGLAAASLSGKSLAGYAAGAAAMILWSSSDFFEPLTPVSHHVRDRLANGTLLNELNWIAAKAVFVGLGVTVAWQVVRWAGRNGRRFSTAAVSLMVITGCHVAAKALWRPNERNLASHQPITSEISSLEKDGSRVQRTVVVSRPGKAGRWWTTYLRDAHSVKKEGHWVLERESPVYLAKEYTLPHLNIEAKVDPATAGIEADAQFVLKPSFDETARILFYLAHELVVQKLFVNGQPLAFKRYGALVAADLVAPVGAGTPLAVEVKYAGQLQLPQQLGFEGLSRNVLFVTSRWYPSLSIGTLGPKSLLTCRAKIVAPADYILASADRLSGLRAPGPAVWVWETHTPVESIPLCLGRFKEQRIKTPSGLGVSLLTFKLDAKRSQDVLRRASEVLATFGEAYGPYPFENVAIVENSFQSAGGIGMPSIISINPDRMVPEHHQRLLDGYLPHELAHLWWGECFRRGSPRAMPCLPTFYF